MNLSTITPEVIARRSREFYMAVPLHLLVGVAFWSLFRSLDLSLSWKAFGLGALGWVAALLLRVPVAALVRNQPKERAGLIVGAFSGPCEELVRWGLLTLTATSFPWAAALGLGWASVEILYTVMTGFATIALIKKDDEKSRMARAELEKMGMAQTSSFWGVFERVFASALHIGFTLMVAAVPWSMPVLVVLHSATNLLAVTLGKRRGMVAAQALIAVTGAGALLIGLTLSGAF